MNTKSFTVNDQTFTFKSAAIPQLRTDRLLDYLTSVGISDTWLTKNVKPLLQRWAEPEEFFDVLRGLTLTHSREAKIDILEKLLKNLFRHQVRDWLEAVGSSDEENTPARDLSDTIDRWTEHATKFGKAMLNVRAVEHEGEILFLADDVAKIYGGSYAGQPATFFLRSVLRPLQVKINVAKKYNIEKLTYQDILAASPSAEADKRGMQKGRYFISKNLMLMALQQSGTKPAMAFRTYLIELETQADVQHKAKKTVVRSAAREKQLEEYSSWDANNRKHKASTIRSNGEIFYHVTDGEYGTQESYCALHGIGKPFANNLPDEIVTATNAVRGITSMFADKQKVTGQHAYERVIAEAAGLVSAMQANPAAMTKAVADLGLTRHPRRFRKNRVINESNK